MDRQLTELQKKLNYEDTLDCIQCGYCLPACPTYESTKKETQSPRGRINLVKQVAEGKMEIEALRGPIEKCLGCMACVVACPTDVQYGKILGGAKRVLQETMPKSVKRKVVEEVIFNQTFPSKRKMRLIGDAAWYYQKSGLKNLLRKTGLVKLAPLHLDQFEQVLPELPSPTERKHRPTVIRAKGQSRVKVGFFTGCVMDSIFFKVNQATIDLLTTSGADVIIPENQTCCGALHAHSGKFDMAKELAMQNIEAFDQENVDYIVNNAGGCGAKLVEYDEIFEDEPEWLEKSREFVRKARDISQILVDLGPLTFTNPVHGPVTYQASCHMVNVQRVIEPPLQLIQSIPGIDFRTLDGSDRCCGSAGIYNIENYDDSMLILDRKMENVKSTAAHTIVTTNPGCLLQMQLGIRREGLQDKVRAVHLVELLSQANPQVM